MPGEISSAMAGLAALPLWAVGLLSIAGAGVAVALAPVRYRIRGAFDGFGPGTLGGLGRGVSLVFEFTALWGLLAWRTDVPLGKVVDRAVRSKGAGRSRGGGARKGDRAAGRTIAAAEGLADVALDLAKKAVWQRLSWTTVVGLSDAAATALTTGAVWVLKANLAAVAQAHLRLAAGQPEYDVTADFGGRGVASRLSGIGVLRVGHIMIALPAVVANRYRLRRAGAS